MTCKTLKMVYASNKNENFGKKKKKFIELSFSGKKKLQQVMLQDDFCKNQIIAGKFLKKSKKKGYLKNQRVFSHYINYINQVLAT